MRINRISFIGAIVVSVLFVLFNTQEVVETYAATGPVNNWTVAQTIYTGIQGEFVSVTPDHDVVIAGESEATPLAVDIIQTGQKYRQRQLSLGQQGVITALATTPDGQDAVIAGGLGNVFIIDISTGVVRARLKAGVFPLGIVITADSKTAFIMNAGNNTVTEIDLQTKKVIRSIPVGIAPIAMSLSPDNRYLYVLNSGVIAPPGSVTLYDRIRMKAITIVLQRYMYGLAVTSDGQSIIATNPAMRAIYILRTTPGNPLFWIPAKENTENVVASPRNPHLIAVFQAKANAVDMIDISLQQVMAKFSLGGGATDMAFTPSGEELLVLVAGQHEASLKVISIPKKQIESVSVPSGDHLDISADGKLAAVVGGGTNVTILEQSFNKKSGG